MGARASVSMIIVLALLAIFIVVSARDLTHRHDPLRSAREACVEVLVDGRLEGSGWFADAGGHVVTAGHTVRKRDGTLEILWPGRGRYPARFVGIDPGHDLGLLVVPGLPDPSPFLRVASSAPPAGSPVQLYGMAQFRHGIAIGGQVARAETTYNYYDHLRWPTRCYLIAAPAPPGVSGGPWLDMKGRVVGNQSGFVNQGTASSGLAIVAPPDAILHLLGTRASIPRATMGCGLEEIWSQPTGFLRRLPKGLEGIVTVPLEPGGAAERGGLTRESVIVKMDGMPVRYRHQIIEVLQSHAPGDTLSLEVWDADAKAARTAQITLDEVPL